MKRSVLVFLFTLNAAAIAVAQPVSVGVLGGVPLIDQTQNSGNSLYHDESRPYIIGPSFEVRLPAGFAIEADALYQRIGNTFSYQIQTLSTIIPAGPTIVPVGPTTVGLTNRTRANLWEFPVLGKYYFRRDSAWQPFIGTGWALRTAHVHESGAQTTINAGAGLSSSAFVENFRSDLQVGATFAAGLRYRVGHFALLPEVRYTRWSGSSATPRRDEAAFFLGISF